MSSAPRLYVPQFQNTPVASHPFLNYHQIGLGDQKSYQLSTTRKELGVVCAVSQAGHQMIPAGTGDMQCTGTGHIEPRKVALGGSDFWWL